MPSPSGRGISYAEADAKLTTSSPALVPEDNMAAAQRQHHSRIVDRENRGWLAGGDGKREGAGSTVSLARPLTDEALE
ncbi:hypothetical protein GCM10023214_45720 [Amycolatopsis dongchuanensis]|uniref:Uncharacterized protein n=2 Tax=Amycolatopsis TaxID=1813 RepID=A0A1I4AC36_9PSEU|nr:hypothetical protein SAMN05421835_123122 [Amycolatopsis sacchari]